MSDIFIDHHEDDWFVWILLAEDGATPSEGRSFIIGVGGTREEAVTEAIQDLEAAIATLRQPVL